MQRIFGNKPSKQKAVEHVKAEMQKALDIAWESKDPKAKELHKKLFPNGKPTLDEFIMGLAEEVKIRL